VDRWKLLRMRVNRRLVDPISGFLFMKGSMGLSYDEITLSEDQELSKVEFDEYVDIKAYFPLDFDLRGMLPDLKRFVASVAPMSDSFAVDTVEIEDFGWTEKWKEFFRPVRVGEKVIVMPSWERVDAIEDEILIVIDPGEAFGTGSHETTRLCIEMIEKAFSERKFERCIDVGCGTGILAILMAKLGAKEVIAHDIDVKAVEITEKNARVNEVDGVVSATTVPLPRLGGGFDLAVANILAEVLVEMCEEFRRSMKLGGLLILSGILRDRLDWVAGEFRREGFEEESRKTLGLWGAITLRKV